MNKQRILWGVGLAGLAVAARQGARILAPRGHYEPADAATGRPGTALITGASSGIGEAFARKLAEQGYNLLLVARREERLAALTAELCRSYGITADYLVADLTRRNDMREVAARVGELGDLALLVNSAGFGTTGKFGRAELDRQLDMINLHVLANAYLTRAALPGMTARRRGAIINVSSLMAFMPAPGNATYSATKSYLTMFSEGLQTEVAGKGVQVQALCPGFTYSEFHDTSEFRGWERSELPAFMWMSADRVVAESLAALPRGDVIVIPGLVNKAFAALARSSLLSPLLKAAFYRVAIQRV